MTAGVKSGEEIILLGPPDGAAPVGADTQRVGRAERGPQFDARAEPGRRHLLKKRRRHAVAVRSNAGKTGVEIADLDIAEREPLQPVRGFVQIPQAGIDTVDRAGREIGAAVAPVRKAAHARLDPAVGAGIEAQANAQPALLIGSRPIDSAALIGNDRHEAVAATVAAIDRDLSVAEFGPRARRRVEAVAAAIGRAGGDAVGHLGIEADGAGQRAWAIGTAATAARHEDAAEMDRVIGAPRDPAAERIGLRHRQCHQRACRGVAAKAAQGDALARRMGAAPVAPAELDEARFVAEAIFYPRAEAGVEAADQRDALYRIALGQLQRARAGNDDFAEVRAADVAKAGIGIFGRGVLRQRRRRHRQRGHPHRQPDHAGFTASGCARRNASCSMHAASISMRRG